MAIDGTAIEADRLHIGKWGVTLKTRKQSGNSKQSKQSGQSGGSQQQQSKQGEQKESSNRESDDEEVTIVFDEDVPEEEREEAIEELSAMEEVSVEEPASGSSKHEQQSQSEKQSKSKSKGKGKSKSESESKGKSQGQPKSKSGKYRTIGFVPHERLQYVIPERIVQHL